MLQLITTLIDCHHLLGFNHAFGKLPKPESTLDFF